MGVTVMGVDQRSSRRRIDRIRHGKDVYRDLEGAVALPSIASATNHAFGQWTPSAWAARNITSAVKEPVA